MRRAGIFASAHVPAAAGGGAEIEFQEPRGDSANASSHNFTTVAIGAASSDRRVVVACAYRGGGPITGVTIGGVSAALDVAQSTANSAEIWSAIVPTGTTATVAIALTGAGSGMGIGVWRVVGDPVDTATMSPTNQSTVNLSLDTQSGDVCIAVVSARVTSPPPVMSWSAATGRYAADWDGFARTHAGGDLVASGASADMGGSLTNFSIDAAAVAVAYR